MFSVYLKACWDLTLTFTVITFFVRAGCTTELNYSWSTHLMMANAWCHSPNKQVKTWPNLWTFWYLTVFSIHCALKTLKKNKSSITQLHHKPLLSRCDIPLRANIPLVHFKMAKVIIDSHMFCCFAGSGEWLLPGRLPRGLHWKCQTLHFWDFLQNSPVH